jgi:DNA-binding transcriptional LysR family regulator
LRDKLAYPREALERVFSDACAVQRIGIYVTLSACPHMPEIVRTFESRHPNCEVDFFNTGYGRRYVDRLRTGDVYTLAIRVPDITIGAILSGEDRSVLMARDDPLAEFARYPGPTTSTW